MEFTIINKKSNNEITLSKDTIERIIGLLDRVDCTCVWSDEDQQYIKVQDVPNDIVDELILKMKLVG